MTKLTTALIKELDVDQDKNILQDAENGIWYTRRQFQMDVESLKNSMLARNVGYGDHVLIALQNAVVYAPLMQAIWEIGAVAYPISDTTPGEELTALISSDDYPVAFVQQQFAKPLSGLAGITRTTISLRTIMELPILWNDRVLVNRTKPNETRILETDLALVLHTSGTTGKPKSVGLTHELLYNGAIHDRDSHETTSKDTALIMMPMFHVNSQIMSLLQMRLAGGRVSIAKKFSASRFWSQVAKGDVTWASVVPTILSILLLNEKSQAQFDDYQDQIHLRFLRSSSFALPLKKLTDFEDRFHTLILEGYGMTETASQCTINPLDAPKVGSAGKPFATDLKLIVDGEMVDAPDVVGEIAVRGDHVISDYLETNPESFHNDWFLTGDLGYLDEDGYLFVKGRRKEMISRGGEKVAPAKVENVLNELPFIEQVAIIGMPDDLYGEAVTAVTILKAGETSRPLAKEKILKYTEHKLAKFERPTEVIFVDEFPLNTTGKVVRPKLRESLLADSVGGEA